ncbi:erythrocyte membrane protein 1, EMP1 [Plasmodium reichenowi]|uniref:Erythrocyte membrane protein 1, EMP1 n=1 Tax=Plasmodium reichenowi TaxID=5854 RepID=A0A060RMB3_PLARE|nr:erythrocyte membrane protein 1, EMP1 [Plasmodium reichenowi]
MGNAASTSSVPEDVKNESENSARNVLDVLARNIRIEAEKNAGKHERFLKGNLKNAKFYHEYSKERTVPEDACNLNYIFHTNVWHRNADDRHPCLFSPSERFSKEGETECNGGIITGNERKIGACAPYRRRHICDYNLKHIDVSNVKSIHDLLGNVLVMAKSEGASIVKSHENTANGIYKSGVCISLARSFADIGDIIRGKDLYLGNNKEKEKIQNNLQKIFQNIKTKNPKLKSLHDEEIREYWWALNRNDVWKALTCNAPYEAHYFIKSSANDQSFSNPKCGHHNNDGPLTNLDYVPQFLRWFDEWAEDFCRIRNHKLKNIKGACRNASQQLYCSLNGYDCTKTIRNENILSDDPKCTGCLVKCNPYEIWLENQRNEFEKQKEKYKHEIQSYLSNNMKSSSSINNKYYKEFYGKLMNKDYKTVDEFIKLLNEGRYCKEGIPGEKEDIDFTITGVKDAFYRSDYCQVCPYCGVEYRNGKYNIKTNKDGNCGKNVKYTPPHDVKPTDITVLYSGNEQGEITKRLSEFCSNKNDKNGKNYQKWECYYVNSDSNRCKMDKTSGKNMTEDKITSFHSFFDLWVKNLLKDTISWENELKNCINNTNGTDCDNECNSNCVCLDKWVKKKEEEWTKVKNVFKNKKGNSDNYYNKLRGLFEGYFFHVIKDMYKGEEKWNKLMENLKKKIESSNIINGKENSQDSIKVLFDHLKETATICKDNNTNEACDSTKTSTQNPCGNNTKAGSKVVSVKQIAQYYKRKAYAQLEERGGSRSALKGDASQGKYNGKRNGSTLNGQICNINGQYSNARNGKSKDPCEGKGKQRFKIGEQWETGETVQIKDEHLFLPPRRRHMCTSNVEYLIHNGQQTILNIQDDKINHSFLGDVLLAAKYEADFIKKNYNEEQNDGQNGLNKNQATTCRAIRYSFADIADIIRGTDLWDKNGGEINTQNNLVKIFDKIKDNLPNGTIKDKYKGDTDGNKYINLRKDWWEANRDQVWNAMQCGNDNPCSGESDHTPLDDYIPQRLRWMTEWAEWYCKVQKKAYRKLKEGCQGCKDKDGGKGCTSGDGEVCKKCAAQCKEYEKKIKEWEPQWKKIEAIYQKLYNDAKTDAINGGPEYYTTHIQEEDKPVVDFLQKLHETNGGKVGPPSDAFRQRTKRAATSNNTPYDNIGAYLHDTGNFGDCVEQKVFCENSGDNKNYAFEETPKEFGEACGCGNRSPHVVEKKQEKQKEDVCNKVKNLIGNDKGKSSVGGCNPKNYNGWKCTPSEFQSGHVGACMPPRRQSLCVHFLAYKNETQKIDTQNDLRDAFIKCAAAETFLAWNHYKSKNGGEKVQNHLQDGTIPDDFKRQMFYTFGDFRDLYLGKDIGKPENDVLRVKNNIDGIFSKKDGTTFSGLSRENWWKDHGKEIWEGMLCALTHKLNDDEKKKKIKDNYSYDKLNKPQNGTNTLEDFASRPQFLRWMTEWGEEFCAERQKKEKEVENKCKNDYEGCKDTNGRSNCVNACEEYKKYISEKKIQYTTQKTKFNSEKTKGNGEYKNYIKKEPHKYLKDKCLDNQCNCIEKIKDNDKYWEKPFENFEKGALINKCECQVVPPKKPEVPPAKVPEVPKEIVPEKKAAVVAPKKQSEAPPPCEIVDKILGTKDGTGYRDGCKTKYGTMTRSEWLCNGKGEKDGDVVCIPPRRRRLFVQKLHDLKGDETQDDLRKAFIETAAVETFFAWHEYKKEKEREDIEKNTEKVEYKSSEPDKLDDQLKSGDIPEEFKRQMFYTLGDYRDICIGNDMVDNTKGISEKIGEILNKPNGQSGDKKKMEPQDWWNDNGKDIWEGMLCALSYDTKTKELDKEVREKLIGKDGKKKHYDYNKVTFEGGLDMDDTSQQKDTHAPPKGKTTLKDFVNRPQFFRWLEEWADEFCHKQKQKLKIIASECKVQNGRGRTKQYSGYGEDCTKIDPSEDGTVPDLEGRSCANSCRFYKKWVKKKKEEFDKLKGKYPTEIRNNKSDTGTTYDEQFVKKLGSNHESIDSFLKNVKGSGTDNNSGCNDINFDETGDTFKYTTHCSPCSQFTVKCEDGNCGDGTEKKCQNKTVITADKFKDETQHMKQLDMLVSDNGSTGFEDLSVCKEKGIFEGIKENKWSCVNFCGLDVCGLKKNNNNGIDEKHIMQIRAFLKLWVENFLEDYSKIKHKISHCIHNGPNKCKCKDKCTCVDEWLKKKKAEWEQIRKRFLDQYKNKESEIYKVNSFINGNVYPSDINNALNKGETFEELQESGRCSNSGNKQEQECKKQDVIEILIHRFQKEINDCKNQPDGGTDSNCPSSSPTPTNDDDHDTTDIPLESFPPPYCNVPANPCSGETATNVVAVKEVAEILHQEAKDTMVKNSVLSGETKDESVLKADAAQGTYNGNGKVIGSDLNGEICNINEKYSNAKNGSSTNPCAGKGDRLEIGETWSLKSGKDTSYDEFYLPKRREHMCTSNVEHLSPTKGGRFDKVPNDKCNHSFLVDVLLAAKKEAENIKTKYQTNNKKGNLSDPEDKATVCRAMKSSFADIGDIIRGRDMWDKNGDFQNLEKYLIEIFGKIKTEFKDKLNGKYTSDSESNKYINLRKDWWEANRDQVWEAMQCKTTSSSSYRGNDITCDKEPTPIDDHIPQRLRWMVEWAEWYCKEQSRLYKDLVGKCRNCKEKGTQCMNGEDMCKTCTEACKAYGEKIQLWQKQWKDISKKYEELYQKAAQNGTTTTTGDTSDKDQQVIEFLKKLHEKNKESNKIYSTAEGYIHQEAHISECQKQTLFCTKTSGETSPSSEDNDKEYAFRDKTYDYEKACDCEKNKKRITPRLPVRPPMRPYWLQSWRKSTPPEMFWGRKRSNQITTCDIVEDIIKKSNDGKKPIDGCHSKNNDNNYLKWECEKYIDKSHTGACIPPRRQKICTHYLEKPMKNTDDLKYAFIKSAAAETFLLWQKYKDKTKEESNGGTTTKLDNKLKDGEIPEEFKREMFYTFADYRDLCLGTDLSSKTDTSSGIFIVKNNIDHVFYKIGQSTLYHRTDWWEKHGPEIWKGMLCVLSYNTETKKMDDDVRTKLNDAKNNNTYNNVKFSGENSPTLEKFAERPQFLRWFTEWGEHFCRERKTQLDKLLGNCKECNVSENAIRDDTKICNNMEKCEECKKQCKKYQDWLRTWKEHYNKQKQRYTQVKETPQYKNDNGVSATTEAYEYLDKQLKNMVCTNGTNNENCDYTCMEKNSTQSSRAQTPDGSNDSMPESLDEKPKEVKDKCNCVRDECTGLSVTDSGFPDGSAFGGGVPADKCTAFKGGLPEKIENPQYDPTNDILKSTIPIGIALALGSIAFLYLKKKPKHPVDLLRVLDIHKGEYDMPTKLSSNRYIPYGTDRYKGKTYLYVEGDTDEEKYMFMSDTTDVTSSESEFEELDINDIYPYQSPKYKTLIEVVLEPSKRDTQSDDIPSDNTHTNKPINDEEWNELKQHFISGILENAQKDLPKNNISANTPMNTQPNTLYFNKPEEKPFITSIHDRNLYTGEEISYNINMSINTMDDTKYVSNNVYSGIDLINDSLSGNKHIDIYDEVLKRKENELFGTRHRDMCEKWEKGNKEKLLDKLKEEWNKDNDVGDIYTSNGNKTLNTNVSIEIDMDNPKPIHQFSNMDSNVDTYIQWILGRTITYIGCMEYIKKILFQFFFYFLLYFICILICIFICMI